MVKVYAVSLLVGLAGLVTVIYVGALLENLGREHLDPGRRLGPAGRMVVGALTGFGMAGLSAEFSPLDLAWPVALGLALVGAVVAALWVRHAAKDDVKADAGPL